MNPMFVKLMMMTTSPHDGEVLTAIRKANAILAGANVNWAEFLTAVSAASKAADNEFRKPPSQRRKTAAAADEANPFTDVGKGSAEKFDDATIIDPMFEAAFTSASGGFRDFLDSVHEWWEDKGFLTEKQYYAVKRAANK
jgi:hypothetical protein